MKTSMVRRTSQHVFAICTVCRKFKPVRNYDMDGSLHANCKTLKDRPEQCFLAQGVFKLFERGE